MNTEQYKELRKNHFFYQYFIDKKIINQRNFLNDNEVIERIKHIAVFANYHHTGLFSDERIENILVEYGRNLNNYISNSHKKNIEIEDYDLPTIIHIATEIYITGGHTRILSQMISRIKDKNQILFLTNQQLKDIPEWFKKEHSLYLKILTYECFENCVSYFDKAIILRRLCKNSERVMLYHHPYDVVPVVAFSNDDSPTIILENHAHSWFWLGSSIADIVFSHSVFHSEFTNKYRTVRYSFYLPFTQLQDQKKIFDFNDKINAKKRLSIDKDTICITAIGTMEKFFPISKKYNFFRLLNRITNKFDNVNIIVIGMINSVEEISIYNIDTEKVRFVGYQPDITDYYLASDISIDSIPEPSLGATIFSNIVGMSCPLFKYGGSGVFDAINIFPNAIYEQQIGYIKDENEFLEKMDMLISNSQLRLEIAESFRTNFITELNGDVLQKKCNELFAFSDILKHKTNKLPRNKVFFDSWGEEIANAKMITIFDSMLFFEKYFNLKDKVNILFHFYRLSEYHSECIFAIKKFVERKGYFMRMNHIISKLNIN